MLKVLVNLNVKIILNGFPSFLLSFYVSRGRDSDRSAADVSPIWHVR